VGFDGGLVEFAAELEPDPPQPASATKANSATPGAVHARRRSGIAETERRAAIAAKTKASIASPAKGSGHFCGGVFRISGRGPTALAAVVVTFTVTLTGLGNPFVI